MTKILALDTSTIACSAALFIDGYVTESFEIAPARHGHIILPMIEALLASASLSLSQLDAIAFGRGPGSFTGLRIAASVTQALAFAHDLPVIPISTLQAMAQSAARQYAAHRVLVALDARMQEVYWGVYACHDQTAPPIPLIAEQVVPAHLVSLPNDELKAETWVGIGEGWGPYAQVLQERLSALTIKTILPDEYPHAMDIAALAAIEFQNGCAITAAEAIPTYLRDKVTS